jgi:hypothetical protein
MVSIFIPVNLASRLAFVLLFFPEIFSVPLSWADNRSPVTVF